MTVWNRIVLGMKFFFGGFEPATDYLLKILNEYLSKGNIADRIQKVREYVEVTLGYLRKYQDFCPNKWTTHYEKLLAAVQTLSDVFEDNKVTPSELEKAINDVKDAITEWMKD